MAELPIEGELETRDGILLPFRYYPSRNGAAVISMGGLGGSFEGEQPQVGFLLESGYGVLQIANRNCASPPAPVTLGYLEALDCEAGIEYLLSRTDVHPDRIGVLGFSMGGVAAIRCAARNPALSAVVSEGGYYNLGEEITEDSADRAPLLWRFGLLYAIAGAYWLQTGINPWHSNPIGDLPTISPRPVFLIYGEYEVEASKALLQFDTAKEPKELWIVPGGAHGTNQMVASREYEERILTFLSTHIKGK